MTQLTLNTVVARKATRLIDDEIAAVAEDILAGKLDIEAYRRKTGQLDGLRKAQDLIADAEATIAKEGTL